MQFKVEYPIDDNKVLGAIWSGFNNPIKDINLQLDTFDFNLWIDEVIFNAKILELAEYHNDIIKGNVNGIIEAYQNIGTYKSYEELLKSLFGKDTIIEFNNPNPAVLNITVTPDFGNYIITTQNNEGLLIKDKSLYIVTKGVSKKYTSAEILKILEKITPQGILVNFNFK